MKLSKEKIESAIACVLLSFWIILVPFLVAPLNMTLFDKIIISTAGAMGGFAVLVLWRFRTLS